jgi:hypothetical protein
MAEVRPWVGSYVSIANFTSSTSGSPLHLEESEPEKQRESVWAHIDSAFSEPVTESDQTADYVSTQILSKTFKHAGYDGLIYKSNLGTGYKVALFDIDAAKLIGCALYRAKAVSFEFKEDPPPYFVRGAEDGDTIKQADEKGAK